MLAALLRFVPFWVWPLLAVGAWGAWNKLSAERAGAKVAQAQVKAVEVRAELSERRADAIHGALVDTATRLKRQQEAATHANELARRARDAAAAAAADAGLLRDAARAAAGRAQCSDPASAAQREATALADVLGEVEGRYREVAGVADAAIVAGIECQRRYDALTIINRAPSAPGKEDP